MSCNLFLAGIVLYNPDEAILKKNIESIISQVDSLLLVDNGSNNINGIYEEYSKQSKIVFKLLKTNLGIATAQNHICQYAEQEGYDWAITLDQDSICPENLVSEYQKVLDNYDVDGKIGMLCPSVFHNRIGLLNDGLKHNSVEDISECIASASAIRISAWREVGGFYEPLFIDKVDFDMCSSLREHGYRIVCNNMVILHHEIGHSIMKYFAGQDRLVLNHAPIRYYYMMRNSIIVARRHNEYWKYFRNNARLIYQVNRYESDRWKKNKMLLKGFFHGIIGKLGKYCD